MGNVDFPFCAFEDFDAEADSYKATEWVRYESLVKEISVVSKGKQYEQHELWIFQCWLEVKENKSWVCFKRCCSVAKHAELVETSGKTIDFYRPDINSSVYLK